jgi:hypothetical protein
MQQVVHDGLAFGGADNRGVDWAVGDDIRFTCAGDR